MRNFTETKTAETLLFGHYLRTGERLSGAVAVRILELKFNQRHYREDGRFARVGEGTVYGTGPAIAAKVQAAKRPITSPPLYPARITLRTYPVRIELPLSTPEPSVIRFPHNTGIDLPDEVVARANTLSDAVREATGHQIHVTSGRRPPHRQADAMYVNYMDGTTPPYANRSAEAQVKRVFNHGRARGLSRQSIVRLMSTVLTEQTNRGIFLSRHMRSSAIDIRTPSAEVIWAIRNHPSVQSASIENDHIHIQFH